MLKRFFHTKVRPVPALISVLLVFLIGLLPPLRLKGAVLRRSGEEMGNCNAVLHEITFTDALGRTLKLQSPERVAVLVGSFADVWCLAGGRDTLVATTDEASEQFGLELPASVLPTGSSKKPNAEMILAAKPDLIIAGGGTASNIELLPLFEDAGIPTVYFKVNTFEEYLAMLDVCTSLTGRKDLYEKNGQKVLEAIKALRESVREGRDDEAPSVLFLRASAGTVRVKNSHDSILGEMLKDLGAVNIADHDDALQEDLSLERILQEDPEKIFIVLQGYDTEKIEAHLKASVLELPAWRRLTAVRSGRVYFMDQRLYNFKPNARWAEAYRGLAEILYED